MSHAERRTAWTFKRLRAARAAVTAMLAGMEGEGDWPADVSAADLQAALDRLNEDIVRATPHGAAPEEGP